METLETLKNNYAQEQGYENGLTNTGKKSASVRRKKLWKRKSKD